MTYYLAYHYNFRYFVKRICGLDYIFTISGATRVVSTEPNNNLLQVLQTYSDYFLSCLPSMSPIF